MPSWPLRGLSPSIEDYRRRASRTAFPRRAWEVSSQSGARVIVYELDTLRHRVGRRPEQLSRAWHASCVVLDRLTTTEQCQVAASPVWDGPPLVSVDDDKISFGHDVEYLEFEG